MTLVTHLLGRFELRLEGLQVAHDHVAAFDNQQTLGLKTREIAGYQLADSPNLGCELLMAGRQKDFDAHRGALALLPRQTHEERCQAVPHGSERKLFDDFYQAPQARSHNAKHFERHLRMREAERLKILFADEEQQGAVDRGSRCRIVSAIEDRYLGDRTARPVDS